MSQDSEPHTTSELAEDFDRAGVCFVPKLLDSGWVETLREAVDETLATPTPFVVDVSGKSDSGRFYTNRWASLVNDKLRAFCLDSPAPRLAAEAMSSSNVWLFRDEILVKEANTSTQQPWHHDLPYWPLSGRQICTVWVALDPISRSTGAMDFVVGSHKWGKMFAPVQIGPASIFIQDVPMEPLPDVERHREDYEIVSFDMEPGDGLIFHALTLHWSGANVSPRLRRRAVNGRYVGDDGIWNPIGVGDRVAAAGVDLPFDPGLKAGDPIESALFPRAWSRDDQ